MSEQEKRVIAYLISTLLVVGFYAYYVYQTHQEPGFDSGTIASFWGTVILIVIAAQVGLSIVTSILVSVLHAIATRELPGPMSDERDRLIDLKATRIAYAVFGVGFVAAMITLALGFSPLLMFHLIVFSLFGAGMVGYLTQLYLYRRGV